MRCSSPITFAFSAFCSVLALACTSTVTDPGATPPGTSPATTAQPDFDAMLRGGDCEVPSAAPVDHEGDIVEDQVWSAGVHRITANVRVLATVTIEACARVELGDSRGIQVGGSPKVGKLVALGKRSPGKLLPVMFVRQDPQKAWGAIVVDATGTADLSTTVLDGGDSVTSQQNGGGMLRVFGKSSTSEGGIPVVTQSLRSDWLLVNGADAIGVNLLRYSGFTDDSTGIAIRGTKSDSPMKMEIGASAAVPPGISLAGNGRDEVVLEQTWSGTLSTTVRSRGVPYRFDGALYLAPVADGAPAVLTVEPGVTLRFAATKGSSGIYIGTSDQRQGQIVAKGTFEAPIRFTSAKATAAPGDWMGLYFRSYPSSGTQLENVVIEYAGGESAANGFGCGPKDNDASILILGQRPTEPWVKNTTLRFGGGSAGIVLGWKSDMDGPDFVSTNRLESMPACGVSRWRSANNTCPGTGEPVCF